MWSLASVFHQSGFSIVGVSQAKLQMYIEGLVNKFNLINSV